MIQDHLDASYAKWSRVLLLLLLALVVCFLLNVSLGSVHITLEALLNYLTFRSTGNNSWNLILSNFRIPKALTALLVGSALGVSGLQMQTLFRNPLAGPYVLGISSGAGLGVALAIFLGFSAGGFLELSGIGRSWLLVIAAAFGSLTVLGIISLAAQRLKDSVTLLIIGLMFGATSGAIVSILQFFSQAENIQAYVIWSFGSLGSLSWTELSVFIPILVLGLSASILLSKPLNTLLLGENYAVSLGLNLKRNRLFIILNTAVLAGTVTAFCGPIAFFGIALPHLTRMLFNTTNHLMLTPLVILFGSILMLIFDGIAQLPGTEITLPINAVTALFGAPFVIYILLKKKTLNYRS
ncbi:iron ABC transporter permease [Marinoscillum furvescens]|uniref:Iron complex transport system permease protein n=1 Tax=Marinoscillum furvescens DSM 4134 TaxID=1122208 RepID=A0A3D9L4Z1_MARFU|nr:iron ABC transporter permease [Marinoscillum furvescens]RED99395.1 iron complex transport system permease protein [Marinoscillum furvescens DSM 4134]